MKQDLIGQRVDILDKGWIELVDFMPHPQTGVSGDLAIVNAARTSFLGESKGAEHSQMQEMIRILLGLETIPKPDDAADALAVAITDLHGMRFTGL